MILPVFGSKKQWAAVKIVSSSRMVPPHKLFLFTLLKLTCIRICQGIGDGTNCPLIILLLIAFFIHDGIFAQVCPPEPIGKGKNIDWLQVN